MGGSEDESTTAVVGTAEAEAGADGEAVVP